MSAEYNLSKPEFNNDEDILNRLQAARQLINKFETLWALYVNNQVPDSLDAEEGMRIFAEELRQSYEALNTELRPIIDDLNFDVSLPLLIIQNAADDCANRVRML